MPRFSNTKGMLLKIRITGLCGCSPGLREMTRCAGHDYLTHGTSKSISKYPAVRCQERLQGSIICGKAAVIQKNGAIMQSRSGRFTISCSISGICCFSIPETLNCAKICGVGLNGCWHGSIPTDIGKLHTTKPQESRCLGTCVICGRHSMAFWWLTVFWATSAILMLPAGVPIGLWQMLWTKVPSSGFAGTFALSPILLLPKVPRRCLISMKRRGKTVIGTQLCARRASIRIIYSRIPFRPGRRSW